MSGPDARIVGAVRSEISAGLAASARRPVVIGICGAQGCGKSTLTRAVWERCHAEGLAAATLSLDDVYLTRAERAVLARGHHSLLATRGVPGTHDVALGLRVIAALEAGEPVLLPRFDKTCDDRSPRSEWPRAPSPCNVLLLEGWCVGARPQAASDLAEPVNALERNEDRDGTWRAFVNDSLAGAYQTLFARIDRLVLLAAPGFEVVHEWRLQQEREADGPMDSAAVARFVARYERLTRHILAEMPPRADCVIALDEARAPVSILHRSDRIAAGRS